MISVVIIVKNGAEKIEEALKSVKAIASEIIVLDDNSTDDTVKISKKYGASIIKQTGCGYAEKRNLGIREAKNDWIFYLDFDEVITPELATELLDVTKIGEHSAYAVPRKNIILGKWMKHGGWYPDYVERLFKKKSLEKWVGELHERPVYSGTLGYLTNPLLHIKENNLSEMVKKTNKWSKVEANLLFEANHPNMSPWRFLRIMMTEIFDRLIFKKGLLDGSEGIIYSIYQMWSRFISYAKLWEKQR